jgi:hypothetical protein
MKRAFAPLVDEAAPELRLVHREVHHAGALGAARRAPAGSGNETTRDMPPTCQFVWFRPFAP